MMHDHGNDSPADLHAAFDAIVSRFHDEESDGRPWPVAEDVTKGEDLAADGKNDTVVPAIHPATPEVPLRPAQDRFVAPDPPMPRGHPVATLSWAGVIGGVVALILGAALPWRPPGVYWTLSLASLISGFLVLVARLPSRRSEDPDDGAVL
jgi:hypothetical protein